MRTWKRASRDRFCGRCRGHINKGEASMEITITEVAYPKIRCAACAGEPVPADLPPLAERVFTAKPIAHVVKPMAHIRTGAVLPFDYKAAQAGREPWEDDV